MRGAKRYIFTVHIQSSLSRQPPGAVTKFGKPYKNLDLARSRHASFDPSWPRGWPKSFRKDHCVSEDIYWEWTGTKIILYINCTQKLQSPGRDYHTPLVCTYSTISLFQIQREEWVKKSNVLNLGIVSTISLHIKHQFPLCWLFFSYIL